MVSTALPKDRRDNGMEGRVARWYATNTRGALDEFGKLAQHLADQLPKGANVLEVASGPGYFCVELAKRGSFSVTGIDISHTFTEIASKNAAEAGVLVQFQQGNASHLPFPDNTFDFLLCRAAFKNFGQPVVALQEMHRVLKPNGQASIIDLRKDVSMKAINRHVDTLRLTPINKLLTKLIFRFGLRKAAYTRKQFEQMLAQTKFNKVDIQTVDIQFEILLTK